MEINIKKGLDLQLEGAVTDVSSRKSADVGVCAVCPDDFHGFTPKLMVKEGEKVAIGQPLLFDKAHPAVMLVSPAAGTVKAVVRGERRKILRVEISVEPDSFADIEVKGIDNRDKALALLCRSGILARMRQRPYDIVPNPDVEPRDIFVTAIDSAPLSPGFMPGENFSADELAQAVKVLAMVTSGKVYISVAEHTNVPDVAGAQMVRVKGPHPSGNVGVQIANIEPVNKGETVWGLDIVTLSKLGKLLKTGHYDGTTTVALTGSEVLKPMLISTVEGAEIRPLVKGEIKDDGHHVRIISGNVLTGVKVSEDGYLHFPYRQITVIPEGDDVAEFMGWASVSPKKMSVSRSFPGHFFKKLFRPDARLLGGRRAMIMSGEFDKVVPMDIMTEYLLKAIIAKDIDAMERLGIYEVAPEDFALAEYVDTSKQPIQQIVRDGLDYLRKELE